MSKDLHTFSLADIITRCTQALETGNLEAKNAVGSTPYCELAEYRYLLQLLGPEVPWASIDACDQMLMRLQNMQASPWTRNRKGDCAQTFLKSLEAMKRETGYSRRFDERRTGEGQ